MGRVLPSGEHRSRRGPVILSIAIFVGLVLPIAINCAYRVYKLKLEYTYDSGRCDGWNAATKFARSQPPKSAVRSDLSWDLEGVTQWMDIDMLPVGDL